MRKQAYLGGCLAAAVLLTTLSQVEAAISYSVMDSIITESFNSLPTDLPSNASIETVYTDGWKDNTPTVPGTSVGLTGWYLYHPTVPAAENGFNGHQRLRVGPGANTGAFWLFGTDAADPEKALGGVGSTTVAANGANMYLGMRLVNNTGQTLTGFTITYDGEQWRDGQSTAPETLLFEYSNSATEANWFDATTAFNGIATANFVAPVTAGTGASGTAVDGNTAGLVPNITGTATGLSWAPNQELWLRWADPQLAGNADDGLAIDNVRFTAGLFSSNPTDITSVTSGLASSASTWSNNQPPSSTNTYRVVSGHTVTVDAPFVGTELRANTGGTVNFNTAGTAKHVPLLVIDDGGNLTETAAGDFALGDISQPTLGSLVLNNTAPVGFNIDASGNFFLDMKVSGGGDINFTTAAGSRLWLSDTGSHLGTIRFNGSGDRVMISEANVGVGTLEMNSTGANTVYFDPEVQSDQGTIVFNQPGTIDHASTQTAPTRRRLHGTWNLVANAPVTVDLSKGFPDDAGVIDERRFLIRDSVSGSADITVNGMSFDPTNPASSFWTTLNEFELGSSGDVVPPTSTYSGVLTANNFVNVEVRHNLPNARIVINSSARMDSGVQTVPGVEGSSALLRDIQVGEIVVNGGGILEVGFEQDEAGSAFFQQTGHHVGHLVLTKNATRGGDLTLSNGATLRMQINGTANELFDRITVQGDVVLDGTLDLLVSPPSTTTTLNANYAPAVGDVFNIIALASGSGGPADFNDNGAVDGVDLDVWKGAFGLTGAGDADGDMDSDGNDFLIWQQSVGSGGALGTITGDFDLVNVIDPAGLMAGKAFQVVKTASAVQLHVVAAVAAIPEPSAFGLAAVAALGLRGITRRPRRRSACLLAT